MSFGGIRPIDIQLSINKASNQKPSENLDQSKAEQILTSANQIEKDTKHTLQSTPNTYKTDKDAHSQDNSGGRNRKRKNKKKEKEDSDTKNGVLDLSI